MADTAQSLWLCELARDIHYAVADDGLAPLSPTDNAKMREAILRALTPERIASMPVEKPHTGTVADIADAELVRRVVSNALHRKSRREYAWACVMEVFGLGSTYSTQLCRRFGFDPDTGARIDAGQRNTHG